MRSSTHPPENYMSGKNCRFIENPSEGLPRETSRRRRADMKYVTRACLTCKERKSKCDGHRPCQPCIDRNIHCKVNPKEDARTTAGRKRDLDTANADDVLAILARVKDFCQDEDKAAVEPLVLKLQQYVSRSSRPTSAAVPDGTSETVANPHALAVENPGLVLENKRNRGPSIHDYILQPPTDCSGGATLSMINTSVKLLYNDLSIGSWTSVTNDSHLIHHLLKLFSTWYRRYIWSTIDVVQLVRDLHSQGSGVTPCNLFLFNIVLSEACIYYDHPDNIELSIKFSEEAERFCEAGAGIISIANAQALMCQAVRHQMMGNDRLGEARMLRALDMQKELEQSSVYEISDDAHKKSKQEIITRMGWAMFNGYAKSAAVLLWPVKYIPSRELVLERDCDRAATDTWSPYPMDSMTRLDDPHCFFRADIELSKIFARISQVLIDDSLDFHRFEPELESICQKLNAWKRDLPICQALCQNAPADYFAQHAEFHWAKIMIHTFVQKQKTRLLSEGLKVNSDKLTKCVTKSDAIYSAQQIAIINHDYMQQFGTRYMQIFMIQPTAIALFLLLTDLDSIENQQSFTVLSEAAAANARLWKLCEAILTMVRQTAEALGVTLPPRAERFLRQDAGTANPHGRGKFEGDYPNFLLASGQIQESEKVAAVIGDLSKMYDALDLNSENPASTKTV